MDTEALPGTSLLEKDRRGPLGGVPNRPFRTPIAAPRPVPPWRPQKPTRFPALRNVLQAGTIISLFCTSSAAGCGLVSGGMHGLAFATVLFTAIGLVGMTLAVGVAAAVDGSRWVRSALDTATLPTGTRERGGGQLSVTSVGEGRMGLVRSRAVKDGCRSSRGG